jgi:hypothetical protein
VPIYQSIPPKIYTKLERSVSESSLKSIFGGKSFDDLVKKGRLVNPSQIKDPYGRYTYEKLLKQLNDNKQAKPVEKPKVVETKVEVKQVEPNKVAAKPAIVSQEREQESQKAEKRSSGKPVFIPPNPEKLMQPTLRGLPASFINYQTNSNDDNKTDEIEKLKEEVDDIEKKLKQLVTTTSNNIKADYIDNPETFTAVSNSNNEANLESNAVMSDDEDVANDKDSPESDEDDEDVDDEFYEYTDDEVKPQEPINPMKTKQNPVYQDMYQFINGQWVPIPMSSYQRGNIQQKSTYHYNMNQSFDKQYRYQGYQHYYGYQHDQAYTQSPIHILHNDYVYPSQPIRNAYHNANTKFKYNSNYNQVIS